MDASDGPGHHPNKHETKKDREVIGGKDNGFTRSVEFTVVEWLLYFNSTPLPVLNIH